MLSVLRGVSLDERSDRFRNSSLLADDLAHVLVGHAKFDYGLAVFFSFRYLYGIRIFDQRFCNDLY